jgi:Putative translation initiation inhibitor, yjgF family
MTDAQAQEMKALGIIGTLPSPMSRYTRPCDKKGVAAPATLNEAFSYMRPSSFVRAMTFTIADTEIAMISGTASINELGESVHVGDFGAQCWRTFRNITEILHNCRMTWHHVVRTSCYLRDIERDYAEFNKVRTQFYDWLALNPYPASTGIQAILCRPELLIEIEAIAIARNI